MATGAASPILASIELDHALRQNAERKQIQSSIALLDDMLKGGIESGRICCISGEKNSKTTIALQFLVTYILSSKSPHAAIIDTTGTFDVITLHRSIVNHLQRSGYPNDPDAEAEDLLQRVRIFRVFDLIGIIEAVNEIREGHETRVEVLSPKSARRLARERLGLVLDSEDEDEEDHVLAEVKDHGSQSASKVGFVMIDNLTSVLNPLLKANHVHAYSVLLSFLRSFSQFINQHNIISIILNSVVQNRPLNSSASKQEETKIPTSTPWLQVSEDEYHSTNHPSIFMSNTIRPALGRSFAHCVDLHLLCSSLPTLKADAQIHYSGVEVGGARAQNSRKADMVEILEIISDRWGDRVGRWAGFTVAHGIEIKPVRL